MAFAVLTFAIARSLVPPATDARNVELDDPQHPDASPRDLGAAGSRLDLVARIALAGSAWVILTWISF